MPLQKKEIKDKFEALFEFDSLAEGKIKQRIWKLIEQEIIAPYEKQIKLVRGKVIEKK